MAGVESGATLLTTSVEAEGSGPVVRVAGQMDLSNAMELEATVDRVVEDGPVRISFDLSGLEFIDTSGLAVLVRCAARVPTVAVLRPSVNVRRVIEVAGLGPLLLTGHLDESRRYAHDPRSVSDARRFAVSVLEGLPDDILERVGLLVSELASNAVRHTDSGFGLRVRSTPLEVRVEVTDHGGGTPVKQSPSLFEPTGRGLLIVDSLSDEWGVVVNAPAGKTVWFRIERAAAATS